MIRSRQRTLSLLFAVLGALVFSGAAFGQLPPEAVDLAEVKISEQLKSEDLCPVGLVPSMADGETWEHAGIKYRGGAAGAKAAFSKDPDTFAKKAEKERWVQNFMTQMSAIWCPITDEVTPGGRMQVEGHGYKWESCCSFCDEEMDPANFDDALTRLRERGEEAFELSGGIYTEGASSPVEGAIRDDV